MCTRFYIDNEDPVLIPIIEKMEQSPLCSRFLLEAGRKITSSGEVFPTDIVPVLAPDRSGHRAVFPMRWGIHLADGTPLFNARSETAAVKPFFRDDWKRHRCIVPASYYFEWGRNGKRPSIEDNPAVIHGNPLFRKEAEKKGVSEKYALQTAGSTVTWLCGLYRIENGLPYFVILTKEPTEDLRKIHDRMPMILPENRIDDWIHPESDPSLLMPLSVTEIVWEKADVF